MSVIKQLDIALTAQTAQFTKGLDKASAETKKLRAELMNLKAGTKQMQSGINDLTALTGQWGSKLSSLAGAAGPIAAVAVGVELAKVGFQKLAEGVQFLATTAVDAINRLDDLGDAAARLDTGVAGFTELVAAGRLADVSFESMTGGLEKFQKKLGDALGGDKGAIKSFKELGLNAKELAKLPLPDAFRKVAEAISKLDGAARQSSAAVDIFGKSGQQLMTILRQGEYGIKAFGEQGKSLGLTLTDLEAEQIGRAADGLRAMQMVMEGLGNTIGKELAPAVAEMGDAFVELAPIFRELIIPALKEMNLWLIGGVAVMKEFGRAFEGIDGANLAGMNGPVAQGMELLKLDKNMKGFDIGRIEKDAAEMGARLAAALGGGGGNGAGAGGGGGGNGVGQFRMGLAVDNAGFQRPKDFVDGDAFAVGKSLKGMAGGVPSLMADFDDELIAFAGGLRSANVLLANNGTGLASRKSDFEKGLDFGPSGFVRPGDAVDMKSLGGLIGTSLGIAPDVKTAAQTFGSADAFSTIAKAMRGGEMNPQVQQLKDANKTLDKIADNTALAAGPNMGLGGRRR